MIPDQWYPVLQSKSVRREPVSARRLGEPLVFWRDASGRLHCLVDRCPHKGARLSRGRVIGDRIQCAYHGFEFNSAGRCEVAPCMTRAATPPASLRVGALPVREHEGLIWLWWGEARETLPPLPLFPEFAGMDLATHTIEWTFAGHYTRYVESLTEVHHVPFVHPSLTLPIPEAVLRTRLFGALRYLTGEHLAKASVVDGLRAWSEGHILRSEFDLKYDDGLPLEQSTHYHYQLAVGMPCTVAMHFPVEGTHAFISCTPIDKQNTWVVWRYLMDRGRYPYGIARAFAAFATLGERYLAQPQDWPILSDQTPDIARASERRFVGADRLNALYLKTREAMLREAAGDRITEIGEPRTSA